MSTQIAYHGYDRDDTRDSLPAYFGTRELAEAYASEGGRVEAFRISRGNPLVLDTPEKVEAAWRESGALEVEGQFYPDVLRALSGWAQSRGHDGMIVAEGAFEGELGYEFAAGTFGEPQIIAFDPERQVSRL
jgi:hypothetical protein